MDILLCILLATLAGGALSVAAAYTVTTIIAERWIPRMVSFAVGIMLATAFLDLLPEAVQGGLKLDQACAVVLCGLLFFFVLEKLALWRHGHALATDRSAIKPAGLMVLVGDATHNFADGVLIAAAFLQDPGLGFSTAAAVIAHEIPQEVGDYLVLLDAGYTRVRALLLNGLCSLASVVGGVLGYFLLQELQAALPYALALTAASFIYVAVADLVPQLHQGHAVGSATSQVTLFGAGIGAIALLHQVALGT